MSSIPTQVSIFPFPLFSPGTKGKKVKSLKDRPNLSTLLPFFSGESLFLGNSFRSFADCSSIASGAVSLHLIPFSRFFYSSLFGKREKQNRRGEFLQPKSGQSRCQTFFPRVHVSQLLSQKRFLSFKKAGRFFISLFFRGRKILNFKRGGKGRM